jgi:hypothetical protein
VSRRTGRSTGYWQRGSSEKELVACATESGPPAGISWMWLTSLFVRVARRIERPVEAELG